MDRGRKGEGREFKTYAEKEFVPLAILSRPPRPACPIVGHGWAHLRELYFCTRKAGAKKRTVTYESEEEKSQWLD